MRWLVIAGILAGILYLGLSSSVRDTSMIWLETRAFGLLAYAFLFAALLLGELRMLSRDKGAFALFRLHVPSAIGSLYLVFLHMSAAMLDNFKWGKYISFPQYLGFSWNDRWLAFLSMGAVGFYLMLLTGAASSKRSIQRIGFRRWKKAHYFSYVAFAFAYIHGANLGTDIRHSALSSVISPLYVFSMIVILSLLIVRLLSAAGLFQDQAEINLAAVAVIILLLGGLMTAAHASSLEENVRQERSRLRALELSVGAQEYEVDRLSQGNSALAREIEVVRNGRD